MTTFSHDADDLLENLMPHLMRSLPDWSEIEVGDSPDQGGSST